MQREQSNAVRHQAPARIWSEAFLHTDLPELRARIGYPAGGTSGGAGAHVYQV